MSLFNDALRSRLDDIRAEGLWRELRRVDSPQGPRIQLAGRELVNFSSNDYLGLANHPALREAALQALGKFGVGSGASRLVCGSLAPLHQLEEALAAFKGTQAALTFSSGYTAALGTVCALLNKDDVIITDKFVHACLVDAARLSGAQIRIFAHNDLDELETILNSLSNGAPTPRHTARNALIVTESVFSMDGDHAPLREIVALKEKYGAWLLVDEAHATGLYGASRRGLAEHFGVSDRIEVQMGTLGKALGASGGYICGSRTLIDYLVNRARSFIFSTAPTPVTAAAATAAINLVQSAEGASRLSALWSRAEEFNSGLGRTSLAIPRAIVPLVIGDESEAVAAADSLRERGFFAPAIRYPSVARHSARLRITLSAAHAGDDVARFVSALKAMSPKYIIH